MNKKYQILDGKIVETPLDTAEIIVFTNPDDLERKYLISDLLIDEHTLNSALDPDELSRMEFEPAHIAVVFKKPKSYSSEDEFEFKVNTFGIFLFKNRLIVVLPDKVPMFNGKLFNNVKSMQDVFIKILYLTIYHYLDHLKAVNMMSESIEQKINESLENKYLLNLFALEKSLVYYLNAINSNSVVINKIRMNAEKMGFIVENIEMLDDLIIENNQCYRQAEIYSNILAGMMDARASIVSNNLNVLMKTLNVITIAIMVPTFVVSAFSMNVRVPIQGFHNAFWIIMGLALCSVICFFIFWRYKKW